MDIGWKSNPPMASTISPRHPATGTLHHFALHLNGIPCFTLRRALASDPESSSPLRPIFLKTIEKLKIGIFAQPVGAEAFYFTVSGLANGLADLLCGARPYALVSFDC
jgi:hypothetical protein